MCYTMSLKDAGLYADDKDDSDNEVCHAYHRMLNKSVRYER